MAIFENILILLIVRKLRPQRNVDIYRLYHLLSSYSSVSMTVSAFCHSATMFERWTVETEATHTIDGVTYCFGVLCLCNDGS